MPCGSGSSQNEQLPPAETTDALRDEELDGLLAPLLSAAGATLAVSGGADSLALLDCAQRWQSGHGDIPLTVLTVDHGLRSGSAAEAAMVARVADERGLAFRLLTWDGPRPGSDVEAAARMARYRLLLEATRDLGASHLVIAHHQNDLAETLLMRLARGAGVFGLAAMRPAIEAGGITILRPFLGVPRERLVATTLAAGLTPAEDPMNRDERFARARIRSALPALEREGIDIAGLAEAARRLAQAADAIDATASGLLTQAASVDDLAIMRLDADEFFAAPAEVRSRALVRILLALGGAQYPPRRERLIALMAAMSSSDGASRKRCLGGVVFERHGGDLTFYRETGRDGLPVIALTRGFDGRWDHRFEVRVRETLPAGATLGPLGEAGRREIGWKGGIADAVAALPALRCGGQIRAVPPLGWTDGPSWPLEIRQIVAERLARPPLFPQFGN
jgi:tRNA(Ile)-lysidine synthase